MSRVTDPDAPFMPLQLHCINENYGFRLTRDAKDDPWQLQQVHYDRETQPNNMGMWLFQGALDNVSPVTLLGRPLIELVRNKGFSVERVSHMDDGRTRIDFVVTSDDAKRPPVKRKPHFKSGQLVLNPRRWRSDNVTHRCSDRLTLWFTACRVGGGGNEEASHS